jgi:hypothetical protein
MADLDQHLLATRTVAVALITSLLIYECPQWAKWARQMAPRA